MRRLYVVLSRLSREFAADNSVRVKAPPLERRHIAVPASRHQADSNASQAFQASTYHGMGGALPSQDKTECNPAVGGATGGLKPKAPWDFGVGLVIGAMFFVVAGVVIGRWSATRAGYVNLSEPVV